MEIHQSTNHDFEAIEALYKAAFPEEDLLPLVRGLLNDPSLLYSLVASERESLLGHIAFTRCSLEEKNHSIALLGPLAVTPQSQGRGVGTALINKGLEMLREDRVEQVQVLGDPNYYGRFGFRADAKVLPPYQLPEEWLGAWQSIQVVPDDKPLMGQLIVPSPWAPKNLWLP